MNSNNIAIEHKTDFKSETIILPASKSISNRALIIDALASHESNLKNISEARDTQTMIKLLASSQNVLDVIDAGTTMRFLTAYLTVTNQQKILTGSNRMRERPIGILVDALKSIGGKIEYQERDGFPPLQIRGLNSNRVNKIAIRGDISSQYISAILMIAPLLENGLKIELMGKIGSRPYIEMTLEIMKSFGVNSSFNRNFITVENQQYHSTEFTIEPDWSAASYWYSFVALSRNSSIRIKGLRLPAIQGDSVIVEIMKSLGVETQFNSDGALLKKCDHVNQFEYDFSDCPDLVQTIAVVCAVKNIKAQLTGLESLKIKETDRVLALQNELSKIGALLKENDGKWSISTDNEYKYDKVFINTYDDHRMAMAFAPLAMISNIKIENPQVVNKSYPGFWDDLRKVNLNLSEVF